VAPTVVLTFPNNWSPNIYTEGYTLYICINCGEEEKRDFVYWITYTVEPNCSQEGFTVLRNIRTGEGWFSNYTDPLGHDFKTIVWDGHGWLASNCTRCDWQGYIQVDEPCKCASDAYDKKDATCTEDGYFKRTCDECGELFVNGFPQSDTISGK
jgi:hypothetical protein